ncbi:DUF6155 family protein [Prolixibacter sp. SD074]|uniref:DUF6155 family protein n=1 Tax=Prolixibacter sp. SD074 TaxID=2652391 RepID=UPI00127D1526|nr:DUF6155 family protein [Prolixibacter sp. SD074]GET29720.1 hypothetical protein SD074_19220 [Prolixibacter sp. SD074]
MSKRELKQYLKELTKEQVEEQILDLYGRFKEVKTFYDFAFNPREDKLLEEAKWQISKEYFPVNGRKPKTRRSVAQKHIRNFIRMGVDAPIIADLMLYNMEVAQTFCGERPVTQEAFYRAMLKSFEEALVFIEGHGLITQVVPRINRIVDEAVEQRWMNRSAFEKTASLYAV